MHNDNLRDLLRRHLRDWTVTEGEVRMQVTGWLKAVPVEVSLKGSREQVIEVLQALITTLVVSERVPE